MNKKFLFLIASLLWAAVGVGLRADAPSGTKQLASFRAVAFSEVKSASVATIGETGKWIKGGVPPEGFHGYKVLSDWEALDPASGSGLTMLLKEPIDHSIQVYAGANGAEVVGLLMPFCIPHPGFAVRLKTDRGQRDFAICLECGIVFAYGDDGQSVEFPLDPDQLSKLKAYYRTAFTGSADVAIDQSYYIQESYGLEVRSSIEQGGTEGPQLRFVLRNNCQHGIDIAKGFLPWDNVSIKLVAIPLGGPGSAAMGFLAEFSDTSSRINSIKPGETISGTISLREWFYGFDSSRVDPKNHNVELAIDRLGQLLSRGDAAIFWSFDIPDQETVYGPYNGFVVIKGEVRAKQP
jgi:hypothetical protein